MKRFGENLLKLVMTLVFNAKAICYLILWDNALNGYPTTGKSAEYYDWMGVLFGFLTIVFLMWTCSTWNKRKEVKKNDKCYCIEGRYDKAWYEN